MKRYVTTIAVCALLGMAGIVSAQTTGTTTLSVQIGPEAALTVNTPATSLTTTSATFGSDFTGSTDLTYKIRTTKGTGSGMIQLKVTSDFSGAGGPSVANPPSTGDALTYTATVATPGTPANGTASTSALTTLANFLPGVSSSKAGNSASVAWDLTDDPAYGTGTYTATVTFTISTL